MTLLSSGIGEIIVAPDRKPCPRPSGLEIVLLKELARSSLAGGGRVLVVLGHGFHDGFEPPSSLGPTPQQKAAEDEKRMTPASDP